MKYRCYFYGRTIGSIGVTYPITVDIKAKSTSECIEDLYKKFEHITSLVMVDGEGVEHKR